MANVVLRSRTEHDALAFTLRDAVAVAFRRRRLLLYTFAAVLLGGLAAAIFMPKYESEMKILVERDRVDPPVTAADRSASQTSANVVTEEDINSEVELLTSNDLLTQVVLANHLAKPGWFKSSNDIGPKEIEKATRNLAKKLEVQPLRKSNVIVVTYASDDPTVSSNVLKSVADFYIEKHTAIHRPTGQFEFFNRETERYRQALADAKAKLVQFTQHEGVVAADTESSMALQKLTDFASVREQTRSAIAETKDRIRSLQAQLSTTPDRHTTQVRTADNPQLMQQLKSTLLTLELKRTELLGKYAPTYRPVQEVEQEIAQTKAAIEQADKAPLRDETTDKDPTHEWIRGELAKATADLESLQARARATNSTVDYYRQSAFHLDKAAVTQDDLLRAAKTAEDNYLMYQRKREEARIADALDSSRILNVALAQQPMTPALPKRPFWLLGLLALVVAGAVSGGAVFVTEFFEPAFRTPRELQSALDLPVLAAIPKQVQGQ
jgi:uncharacterized protein involved in exopolysaccharide biosynthesis